MLISVAIQYLLDDFKDERFFVIHRIVDDFRGIKLVLPHREKVTVKVCRRTIEKYLVSCEFLRWTILVIDQKGTVSLAYTNQHYI